MDPDGMLVEANETALRFGGIDPEEAIGEYLWDTYWWEDSPAARERARDAVSRASDGEVVLLIPEGRDITEMKA